MVVAGGVAAIVYGEPRFTQDLDIVASLLPSRAGDVAGQFPESTFYCPPETVIAEEAAMGLDTQWDAMERLTE